MTASGFGEACFDHYVRFLRQPAERVVFEHPHGAIQVLGFPKVFPRCTTFCTLGYSILTDADGRGLHEVMVAVDQEPAEVPMLLVRTLLTAAENGLRIEDGISIGGLAKLAPRFAARTRKTALLFTEPFPLPPEFAAPRSGKVRGHIHMAVPISEAEHCFVKEHGGDALERLLANSSADPFDVLRPSVVADS